MKLPQILPPSNLLEQVEGVEQGLRRGRSLRALGVLLAAVQVTVLVLNSSWLAALLSADWGEVADRWLLLVPVFLLVLSILMVNWTRFWLKESQEPFRYTYSIAPFEPAGEDEPKQLRLAALQPDLRERLSTRIPRLSLLDDCPKPDPANEASALGETVRHESHIHINGYYARRQRLPDKRWFMEIAVWVRVGDSNRAATLALPVKYPLDDGDSEDDQPPELLGLQYEQLLERTYFSAATEIYRQIKRDVGRKIDVLPSRYFRAAAYFHEAKDYARSNTLDAYSEARDLYARALELYDPGTRQVPDAMVRRPFASVARLSSRLLQWLRHLAAHVIARLGRAEVLAARAQIGYANTVLYRAFLASLQGRLADPTFETIPVARSAVKRLLRLPRDVRGRDSSLFDAYVTLALSHALANSPEAAKKLEKAHALRPFEADNDPRYLFVAALLEDRLLSQVPLFQRAAEIDPQFEVAHYQLAMTTELFWRTRPSLELSIAKTVFRQYGEVLRLNPGNIAAWANRGYVKWLLGQGEDARRDYLGGRQYKDIKPDTYVAELDHGLARIAAEAGRFEEAYGHYINAVSARLAQGKWFGQYSQYQFDLISKEMLNRFEGYKSKAAWHLAHPREEERAATTQRIRNSVHAFVLNDYGEACHRYYLRSGDYIALEQAFEALNEAAELNKRYVLPWWNLYWVQGERQRVFQLAGGLQPGEYLDKVEELEPGWSEAAAEILRRHSDRVRDARQEADRLSEEARTKVGEATQARVASLRYELASDYLTKTELGLPFADSPGETVYVDPQLLESEAKELERQAKVLRDEAADRETKAQHLPRVLLPHTWLWRKDDVCTEENFNWGALRNRAFKRELRWERSLDYNHVRGLFAWTGYRLGEQQTRWATRLERLLDLIEERFWPNEFELLALRNDRAEETPAPQLRRLRRLRLPRRPKPARPSYRDRMTDVVKHWLTYDDTGFASLSWLDLNRHDTYDHFQRVAERDDLSPYLYRWLGDKLAERHVDERRVDLAVAAYKKAMAMDHPGVLLELGQKLEELGQFEASVECYVRAKESKDPMILERLGDTFMELGRYSEAFDAYSRARELDGGQQSVMHDEHVYRANIAKALFARGRFERALAELDDVEPGGGDLGPMWRSDLVRDVIQEGSIRSSDQHALLRSWLEARQRDAVTLGEMQAAKDAAEALFLLTADTYAGMNRSTGSVAARLDDELVPMTTPIVLEAHFGFFPQGRETPEVSRMIDGDIPHIRDAIQAETGVVVPGFFIQSSPDVAEREYAVHINEVPVSSSVVPADVDDPYAVMLEGVERVVRSRLATFLDVQAVEKLLDDWCETTKGRQRVDSLLQTDLHRRRFTLALKELVAERVPIVDIGTILGSCQEADLANDDLASIVNRIRFALRRQLPGRTASRMVELPASLEQQVAQYVRSAGPKRFLAMPEAELAGLRGELHGLLDGQNGDSALVIARPELLPFVHQVVRLEYPQIPVLASAELAGDTPPRPKSLLAGLRR